MSKAPIQHMQTNIETNKKLKPERGRCLSSATNSVNSSNSSRVVISVVEVVVVVEIVLVVAIVAINGQIHTTHIK